MIGEFQRKELHETLLGKKKPQNNPNNEANKQTKKPLQRNPQHFGLGSPQTVGDWEDILGIRARYFFCFETLPYLKSTFVLINMLDGPVLSLILLWSTSRLADRRKLFFHMFYFKIILCLWSVCVYTYLKIPKNMSITTKCYSMQFSLK